MWVWVKMPQEDSAAFTISFPHSMLKSYVFFAVFILSSPHSMLM